MKKLICAFLSVIMLLVPLTSCSGSDGTVSVTTAKVKNTNTLVTADYYSSIHSSDTTAVISTVTAKVVSVNVKLGQHVSAGDVLMQLDTSDAQLALKQAQAGLDNANAAAEKINSAATQQALQQASQTLAAAKNEAHDATANYNAVKAQYNKNLTVAPAQAAYDKAQGDYNKVKLMFSTGAASQFDLTNAQNALTSAAAQLQMAKDSALNALNAAATRQKNAQNVLASAQQNDTLTQQTLNPQNQASAKAAVDAAQVAVDTAQKRIDDSLVKAPIDGTVGVVNVKKGDLSAPQTPAFQIVGGSYMTITVNVTESLVDRLTQGQKATVFLSASGRQVEGTVSEIASMALPQTGMFPVKLTVADNGKLRDGMQAAVHFNETGVPGTVLVPVRSVLNQDGKSVVYAVRSGKAAQVEVTVSDTQGAYDAVKGLNDGDEVVVQGIKKVKDGSSLHIVSNING
ncbi:efflux RND transporter periplasmic adaptor subunit [Caproiciproducens faecalis]|uniref:Efflux RND transporter periplasmic adaptor subunit n=1 Tax=Caproiciproducens faecalis TaxID=2820301 RepID=A0ABS7DLZ1_9FIRM|nr:efflux RND transporter periplasmic adaptor subunit [Caproiciproducens faecalis]MBW7572319.1 efflux RND transporter periplasmic adaptor subunit [Caproiciproducens faecalis]